MRKRCWKRWLREHGKKCTVTAFPEVELYRQILGAKRLAGGIAHAGRGVGQRAQRDVLAGEFAEAVVLGGLRGSWIGRCGELADVVIAGRRLWGEASHAVKSTHNDGYVITIKVHCHRNSHAFCSTQ
ncbi:hypothetical protein NKJ23_32325 [Mesorhizobium sp. M0184]